MPGTATLVPSTLQETIPKPLVILGIQGSPRGITSRTRLLIQWVLAGAADAGAEVDLMDLTALKIEACIACESCTLTGQCVFNDDFPSLYDRMLRADGIVLGSPVYIDHVTGQMKVFIDRLADAIHYQGLFGKYGCSVSTTWSSGGEQVISYLNHVLNYLGVFALPGMWVAVGDDDQVLYRAENQARKMGERLVGAIKTKKRFPGQEAIIADNRAFFAQIVEKNRECRPEEYEDWIRRGWIR
ncbi:MAG: flavodoxin family protein [Methanoregulaceae archaeon]|nr:flavodoxin family protein [Methanoregulaceae archaeon]